MAKGGTGRAALLPVSFFRQDTGTVARALLGALVVSEAGGARVAGRIVETEAYLGVRDPASHGFEGRRHARNEALYGPAGSWYVYLSYGMHWCCNLVCEGRGEGGAVLLRALEPVAGLDAMRARRGGVRDAQLCAGPGRLAQALGIDRALDGRMMAASAVTVRRGEPLATARIVAGPRIGITKAAEWPLRFCEAGSPWLSRPPAR
jgi:DNA-3-methyladenine glycosylase